MEMMNDYGEYPIDCTKKHIDMSRIDKAKRDNHKDIVSYFENIES